MSISAALYTTKISIIYYTLLRKLRFLQTDIGVVGCHLKALGKTDFAAGGFVVGSGKKLHRSKL